mgnify:CR=1 FL=1
MDNQATPYTEPGPTPSWTHTERPASKLNAKIFKIVSELGIRYRPLTQADQEAHTLQVALLTKDLADVSPPVLALAADEWSKTQRYMPRAYDLLEMCRKMTQDPDRRRLQQAHLDHGNNHLADLGRRDVHWIVRDGQVRIEQR